MPVRAAALLAAIVAAAAAAGPIHFVEVAQQAGIDFVHDNGMRGELWPLEIVGAGVAVLDVDGDGWMDVYLVQGGAIADEDAAPAVDRLYRNLGPEFGFEDITDRMGIRVEGYGMGVAAADVDGDGDTDLFRTAYGPNRLLLNAGDGRFRDATADSGLAGGDWSISASFADIDGDGLPDLYVANYLDFDPATHEACELDGRRAYCPPGSYRANADRLYRNLGGGRFEDISDAAGIRAFRDAAMGVAADDFDGDGRTDFYVANDATPNRMWRNLGGGRFEDIAATAGASVNGHGEAEASMGVALSDFDADGDPDIFLTHDVAESNTLYVNERAAGASPRFADRSARMGLAAGSLAFTGFGTGWLDADRDGDLDLFVANGPVRIVEEQRTAGIALPLRQRNLLLENAGGRFRAASAGPALAADEVSRGAAFGDLDNDGDIDIVVSNNHGPARLYLNETGPGARGNWLGLDLRGPDGSAAIGATVRRESSPQRWRVRTDGSYASASDPRIVMGLGSESAPQTIRVTWPGGTSAHYGPLAPNQYHRLAPP